MGLVIVVIVSKCTDYRCPLYQIEWASYGTRIADAVWHTNLWRHVQPSNIHYFHVSRIGQTKYITSRYGTHRSFHFMYGRQSILSRKKFSQVPHFLLLSQRLFCYL